MRSEIRRPGAGVEGRDGGREGKGEAAQVENQHASPDMPHAVVIGWLHWGVPYANSIYLDRLRGGKKKVLQPAWACH